MRKAILHPELCQRIGFGCGRLVGGTSFKESAQLIETAAELGIRYFDSAPSYGLGSAERVLGEVLGGDTQFQIATKVGISRPKNTTMLLTARSFVAPIVNRVAPLKRLALSYLSRQVNQHEMSNHELLASFEESLYFLKRDSVDVLFLHEAIGIDNPKTRQFFEQMHIAQKCRYYGAAISAQRTDIVFGNAVQLGFGRDFKLPLNYELINVHGVIKNSPESIFELMIDSRYQKFSTSLSGFTQRQFDAAKKIINYLIESDNSRVIISFNNKDTLYNVLRIVNDLVLSDPIFYI